MQLPDKSCIASFDVHAQKSFTSLCPKELPVPDGLSIVDELNAQARFACLRIGAKEAHNPNAIWVADDKHPQLSPVSGDNVDVRWVPHSIVGTKGFELIDGLPKITNYDYYVWMGIELDLHPYGACYHDIQEKLSTGVIEYLRAHAITTVILGGLATDYCVKNTARQLSEAKFTVILNLGACRGISPDTVKTAMDEMRVSGIKMVNSASEFLP